MTMAIILKEAGKDLIGNMPVSPGSKTSFNNNKNIK